MPGTPTLLKLALVLQSKIINGLVVAGVGFCPPGYNIYYDIRPLPSPAVDVLPSLPLNI